MRRAFVLDSDRDLLMREGRGEEGREEGGASLISQCNPLGIKIIPRGGMWRAKCPQGRLFKKMLLQLQPEDAL